MSVLKQITGLENIAPLWNDKILKGDLTPESGLNLKNAARCIVGEAHGYVWPYGCDECNNYGSMLWYSAKLDLKDMTLESSGLEYNGRLGITSGFMTELKGFIDHFNRCHK